MRYAMRWSVRSGVVLLAGMLAVVFGAAGADAARATRAPGVPAELFAVFCTSPGNCWAVGDHFGNGTVRLNQVLRWNGSKWRSVPVPEPGGTVANDFNTLTSVRCFGAGDCWAVGFASKDTGAINQVLHWNGTKWSHITAPSPGPTLQGDSNQLADVTCVSPADCWAVGWVASAGKTEANQALHWNGRKWSLVSTPDPGGTTMGGDSNQLNAVRCTSASACLADGFYTTSSGERNEVLRWSGKKWSLHSTPNPGGTAGRFNELNGLGCSSSDSCWAAGDDGTTNPLTSVNQMLHWNGRKWFTTKVPDPAIGPGALNDLLGDTCLSATDCWAVGWHGHTTRNGAVLRNDTLHWNGVRWSHVSSPSPGGTATSGYNELHGIRCTAVRNCWTVGVRMQNNHLADEILHWNGTKWTSVDIVAG